MANQERTENEQGQQSQNDPVPESSRQQKDLTRSQQSRSMEQRGAFPSGGPFSLMRRLSDDMDRMFEGFFGIGRRERSDWPEAFGRSTWWPQIEVSRKDDKLVVQADVPGMKKEDVSVEIRDDEICISGERRSESEHNEGGYYRSERNYGSFCRSVPLPQGAKPETATATFENGVLRVEIEAPAEASSRGRRIEVR